MTINIKLNKNFTTAFNKMVEKYGEEFELLNGFHDRNLNLSSFIDAFIDSENNASATIDANANVQSKDICNLERELPKPFLKLLAFNKVFYEIQKKYGVQTARDWLESEWIGNSQLNNATEISYKPYCYSYDLTELATKGMFFIPNIKTKPAQHLTTFTDHILEFVSWTSNRTTGAVGLPNILVWMWYFWQKDAKEGHFIKSPEYYRDQCFQKLIFDLNMPYLRQTESAFTNMSIFDKSYCFTLFGGYEFPDGTLFVEHIDEFIEFQKAFMKVMSKERQNNLFTFPVDLVAA